MRESYRELQSIEQMEDFFLDKTIIIYGTGSYGQSLIDFMCSAGKRAQIGSVVVTDADNSPQKTYAGFHIQKAEKRFRNIDEEWVVIAVSIVYREELCELTGQYTSKYICISDRLYYGMKWKLHKKLLQPVGKVDFCVAGFAKCGTTSLFGALSERKDIYLPQCKETLFFEWYKKMDAPERFLQTRYLDGAGKGQMVGMIEPSFCSYAKEVKQLLGNQVKIIFLVRNPADALFSYFKMSTRSGSDDELGQLYEKDKFSAEMYTEYLRRRISMHALTMANYSFWIGQYLEIFPKEQIMVIFFEDLIKNTHQEMNRILEYIGCSESYEGITLPHINSGNFVMSDREGYRIAVQRRRLIMKIHSAAGYTAEDRERLSSMNREFELADKIYDVRMTPEQRALAKDFFDEDVKWLENMTGRKLSELWNW